MLISRKIPLLKNHHTHPSVFAALQYGLDMSGFETKAQALTALAGQTQEFNLALGWNNSRYTLTPEELDTLAPTLICNVSFHEFLVNTPARQMFATAYPEVMKNIDDTDWVERNLHQILKFIAGASGITAEDIAGLYQSLAQEGVWYAEDMLLPGAPVIELYKAAGCFDRTRLWADMDSFEAMSPAHRHGVSGIKLFLDGAVGARTAALYDPYLSGETGILLKTDQQLSAALNKAAAYEKPVSVHTIGNRSTEQLICVLEGLEPAGRPPEIRAEHCQFISPEMASRAKSMGIILSMQPNFTEDSIQYLDRLPRGYDQMNTPFRMLIDEAGFIPGQDLFFGSDGPPHGVEYSFTSGLFPPLASQVLTLDELIAGYCMTDFTHGCIDIDIDYEKKTVGARVLLAEKKE